jgi:hypothetical protein
MNSRLPNKRNDFVPDRRCVKVEGVAPLSYRFFLDHYCERVMRVMVFKSVIGQAFARRRP